MIEAVVFDLDGVLIDSEGYWDRARRDVTIEAGGHWGDQASADTLGMSTPEWAAYLHDELGVRREPQEIESRVVALMRQTLLRDLPLIDGAQDAVRRMAAQWPIGLATSSTPTLVEPVLAAAGIADLFRITVTAEQVGRGKPAPDVYLAALDGLRVEPRHAVAIEDSSNGLRSARAAGMHLIAIPNPQFPPSPEALVLADVMIGSLAELTPELVLRLPRRVRARRS